jgi:peptidoglycan/xylan/chitin deacetylase (PgdA/CDA1 family)
VCPKHFAEHLDVLHRGFNVISLRQLCRALAAGRPPERAVVITFDDGYVDNLHTAKPLLQRLDLAATVFLTSGQLDQGEFWWDTLEQLVRLPRQLPPSLELVIDGNAHRWDLRESDRSAPARGSREAAGLSRQQLFRELASRLKLLTERDRSYILSTLEAWSGARPQTRSSHRALTRAEARSLAADPLIEIGAHTITHPVLPWLDRQTQRLEIEQSKAECEALIEEPVRSFAYPYGLLADETAMLVAEAGFACACTCEPSIVHCRDDPYLLSRMEVKNWPGAVFAREMASAFLYARARAILSWDDPRQ